MANPDSSQLNASEVKLMDDITKDNKLMRRKLKSSEPTENKRSSRRVPVRVYVKKEDAEEIPNMRKKMKELEKMQNMYKQRIDELENQIVSFSSFRHTSPTARKKVSSFSPNMNTLNASPRSEPNKGSPRRRHLLKEASMGSLGDSKSSGLSGGSEMSGITIDTTCSASPKTDDSSRRSSRSHDRTKLLALYDYVPADDAKGRLAFKEGEVLMLVNMKSRSGWWMAELDGQVGKIPSNYVEQLDPSKSFKAKVIKNFDAVQPGDMSIQRGSLITILKRQENGWYLGEKGHKTGFFPSVNVERVTVPLS